jgi:hypothetical protein
LVVEQSSALAKCHPVHVLYDEGGRLDASQGSVELPVEEVDWCSPIAFSALGVALTRIATDEQFSGGKLVALREIVTLYLP